MVPLDAVLVDFFFLAVAVFEDGAVDVPFTLVAEVPLALADWLPVVAVAELAIDWSPVVVVVVLDSDWSPVEVVLSMVRLERPRRSIVGLNVDVEPVTAAFTSEVDPVIDEVVLAAEPVTAGLTVVVLLVDGVIAVAPASVPVADAAAVAG